MCAALYVIEFDVARKKTPREIRCSILVSGLVRFNSGDGIVAAEPAIEINLGAARRAEGMEFLQRRLAANGAGPAWLKTDRVDH